jgi:hypothetical protein
LEALDEQAGREGGVVSSRFSEYDQHDWYRVRRSLLATVKVIAETANKIAPGFVSDQGTIDIEILPVAAWASEPDRVRVVFVEDSDGERRDIGVLGAGTARWVAAAVRFACQQLRTAARLVLDPDGAPVTDPREANRIIEQARNDPLEQSCFRFEPVHTAAIYLVDEPEAHLHPRAVASVAQWLVDLAASASAVVVATHNTTILNAPREIATPVLVVSGSDGTELRTVTGDLSTALECITDELGLSRGELLLLARLALFVEGPEDVAVLEEWFRPDLDAAGVRLFSIHGIYNVSALVDSEVIAALGLKMGMLFDNADADKIRRGGQPGSNAERRMVRLRDEARRANRPIREFGLDEHDIVFYLDDAICRAKAAAFPGWRQADRAWKAVADRAWRSDERPPDFKQWVGDQYGLRLDRISVRDLARTCKAEGKVHPEVYRVVQTILAYAGRSGAYGAGDQRGGAEG